MTAEEAQHFIILVSATYGVFDFTLVAKRNRAGAEGEEDSWKPRVQQQLWAVAEEEFQPNSTGEREAVAMLKADGKCTATFLKVFGDGREEGPFQVRVPLELAGESGCPELSVTGYLSRRGLYGRVAAVGTEEALLDLMRSPAAEEDGTFSTAVPTASLFRKTATDDDLALLKEIVQENLAPDGGVSQVDSLEVHVARIPWALRSRLLTRDGTPKSGCEFVIVACTKRDDSVIVRLPGGRRRVGESQAQVASRSLLDKAGMDLSKCGAKRGGIVRRRGDPAAVFIHKISGPEGAGDPSAEAEGAAGAQ